MKTQKNYRHQIHDGDSCKVHSDLSYEEHLIEDHPYKQIEDHPRKLIEDHHEEAPVAAAAMAAPVADTPEVAAVGAPIEGGSKSHWWAWCVAALVGLCIVAAGLYYGLKNDNDGMKSDRYAYASTAVEADGQTVGTTSDAAAPGSGSVVDYIYYFGNDKSAVIDNSNLENMAEKIEDTGADVVVTAYASQVGNEAYNKALSEKRANNIASYLVAHGVPKSHIKVVSNGETTNYGDEAHNRRANIHVEYPVG